MNQPSKQTTPKAESGRAWIGAWRAGQLGWAVPTFIHYGCTEFPDHDYVSDNANLYLCQVTIAVVLDRNGRPIKRTAGGLRSLKGLELRSKQ